MMASLKQFISKAREWGMPFCKMLRRADGFQWDEHAEDAFHKVKAYLKAILTLIPPQPEEELMLHVAATDTVASIVFSIDRPKEGGKIKQWLVYFISEINKDAHTHKFRSYFMWW